MRFRSRSLPGTLAAGVFLVCAACGRTPPAPAANPADAVRPGTYYVSSEPVYAWLDKGSGGSWMFSKVTASDTLPDKGYLVRLNDLGPAFDTRVAECTPQVYPENHRCNPVQPFREKDTGVLDKLISGGIAVGTAGKVTEVSRTYKTTFDEAAFNQAVDEALINSGLDADRQSFLAKLHEYKTLLSEGRAELADLQTQTTARYHDTSSLRLDIQPRIAGLIRYYNGGIDFRSLVQLVPTLKTSAGATLLTGGDLLPCDARNCARLADAELARLRAEIAAMREQVVTEFSPESAGYEIRCDATMQGGYLFTLQCPSELTGTNPFVVPILIDIHSRDFEGLYPELEIADEQLALNISGDTVTFTNRTQSYVSVNAQTVYYNSQVHTRLANINLAPGVAVSRPMSDFISPAIEIESSYRQMTPDKAAGSSFRFGFAAKYRVNSEPKDTTLYDVRTFNVGCVIDNRVEPGSCPDAAPAETQQEAVVDEPIGESAADPVGPAPEQFVEDQYLPPQ